MRGRRSLSSSPPISTEGDAVSDDDANADLSIAVLAKAKDRTVHASPIVTTIVLESDDNSDTGAVLCSVENGVASNNEANASEDIPLQKSETCKKGKSKNKRKMKDAQNIRTDNADPITEESKRVAGDVLFKLIADDGEDNLEMRKLLRGPRYFDLEQKTEICFRCGNSGHIAAKCTEEIQKKTCYVCGSHDHEVIACPLGSCFICKGSGHFAKTCPKKRNGISRISERSKICLRCGEEGHELFYCNSDYHPEDIKVIKCYVCKSYGHLCCVDVALTLERKDSCYNCGEQGHTGVGCAKARNENSKGLAKVCYKCGEEGHFARGCKRDKDDLWSASRTRDMINTPIEGDFQGFRSVPAMSENSRQTHMLSNERATKDRWNMNEDEKRNKFNRDSSRYDKRQNQLSPKNMSRWDMNKDERGNKYESHGSSYGKRRKHSSPNNGRYRVSDNHSKHSSPNNGRYRDSDNHSKHSSPSNGRYRDSDNHSKYGSSRSNSRNWEKKHWEEKAV